MLTLLLVLEVVFGLAALITGIFVIVCAFKDEAWKGVLCLFCSIYTLYYAVTENDMIFYKDIPVGIIYAASVILLFINGFAMRAMTPH